MSKIIWTQVFDTEQGRVLIGHADMDERAEVFADWQTASLEGLERWEAKHGLGEGKS